MKEIKKVGVLGGGLMGSGIAQVSAAAGFPTTVREVSDALCAKSKQSIEKSLIIAAQFDVFEPQTVQQGVVGKVQHMITLVIGQMALE